MDQGPEATSSPHWRTAAVALAAALALALSGLGVLAVVTQRSYPETSPEVGFARDMYVHHEQAVGMSLLVRERGSDPQVAALARDLVTSQAEQQGVMLGQMDDMGARSDSAGGAADEAQAQGGWQTAMGMASTG